MKNALHIVQFKVYNRTVIIIGFFKIVQISVEKLSKSYAYFFSLTNVNFIELFLTFLADDLFRDWDIPFVCIADDKIFK